MKYVIYIRQPYLWRKIVKKIGKTCHEPAVRLRVYEIEAAGCNVDFIGNFTQESLGGL